MELFGFAVLLALIFGLGLYVKGVQGDNERQQDKIDTLTVRVGVLEKIARDHGLLSS